VTPLRGFSCSHVLMFSCSGLENGTHSYLYWWRAIFLVVNLFPSSVIMSGVYPICHFIIIITIIISFLFHWLFFGSDSERLGPAGHLMATTRTKLELHLHCIYRRLIWVVLMGTCEISALHFPEDVAGASFSRDLVKSPDLDPRGGSHVHTNSHLHCGTSVQEKKKSYLNNKKKDGKAFGEGHYHVRPTSELQCRHMCCIDHLSILGCTQKLSIDANFC
jgi:hypothetical protein